MRDTELHNNEFSQGSVRPRVYSPAIQPLLQSLLATLADIDFEFERERDKLVRTTTDASVKHRVLEKLRAQHRERREPYVQQLAVLQERILDLTGS